MASGPWIAEAVIANLVNRRNVEGLGERCRAIWLLAQGHGPTEVAAPLVDGAASIINRHVQTLGDVQARIEPRGRPRHDPRQHPFLLVTPESKAEQINRNRVQGLFDLARPVTFCSRPWDSKYYPLP